jgi:hypothetical protein
VDRFLTEDLPELEPPVHHVHDGAQVPLAETGARAAHGLDHRPVLRTPCWGVRPITPSRRLVYRRRMNILLLLVVLLLLFGGGGFYFGGPAFGGGGIGLVLLICLVIYLAGGLRSKKV